MLMITLVRSFDFYTEALPSIAFSRERRKSWPEALPNEKLMPKSISVFPSKRTLHAARFLVNFLEP